MNLNGKKVLVTGGAGFIGSHLVERLVNGGADVRVLVRYNSQNNWGMLEKVPEDVFKSVEVHQGDLRNSDSIRDAVKGVQVVFHLGAIITIPYSLKNPIDVVENNVMGTSNLLRLCVDKGIDRLVHMSSSEVYGTAQHVPIDEKHPLAAYSPYAATKIAAEKLVESFAFSYKLPAVIVRPFNTYGPRQSARAIIPAIIFQAMTQHTIWLGNLSPTRDFNYVHDIVEGLMLSAETDAVIGEVLNLGSHKEISIKELVKMILKILKREKKKIRQSHERLRPASCEVFRLLADNRKARDMLGWTPKVRLEDGLNNTIEWIRQNIDFFGSRFFPI